MQLHQAQEMPARQEDGVRPQPGGAPAQFHQGVGQPYPAVAAGDTPAAAAAGLVPAVALEQGHIPGEGHAEAQPLGSRIRQREIEHVAGQGRIGLQGAEHWCVVLHRVAAHHQQPGGARGQQGRPPGVEPQRPHQAPQLGQQGGGNPPGMAQVVAGPHRLEQGANRAEQGLGGRLGTQEEVVTPDRVIGLQGGEVLAVAAGAASFGPQMVDQGGGLVVDAPAAIAPAVGEFGLEVIGHLHEVGVEAPQAAGP